MSIESQIRDGRSFTVTTDLTTIPGTEYPLLLLRNPSGSGSLMHTTKFKWGGDSSSARSVIRIYAQPTVTADGTQLNQINTFIQASPPTSFAEAYLEPTVSDNGSILNMAIAPVNSASTGISRTYFMEPGTSLLVTIDNSITNVETFADVYWLENV